MADGGQGAAGACSGCSVPFRPSLPTEEGHKSRASLTKGFPSPVEMGKRVSRARNPRLGCYGHLPTPRPQLGLHPLRREPNRSLSFPPPQYAAVAPPRQFSGDGGAERCRGNGHQEPGQEGAAEGILCQPWRSWWPDVAPNPALP